MSDSPLPPESPSAEPEPTLAGLIATNLKILAWMLAFATGCFLLWRGLTWLFPDIEWLRLRR